MGIDFEDAIRIFDAPVLEKAAARRDYGENRIIAFGVINEREPGGRLRQARRSLQDYIGEESTWP